MLSENRSILLGFNSNINNYVSITERTEKFSVRLINACIFLDEKLGVARTLSRQLLKTLFQKLRLA